MTPFDNLSELPVQNTRVSGRMGLGTWLITRLLNNIHRGRLRITLPGGGTIEKSGTSEGIDAILVLHNWRAIRRLFVNGDIGFAEGFIENDWSTPDLTALIRFAAQNRDAFTKSMRGSLPMRLINRLAHGLNANTRRGSRRNIEAHYDLGNEFYRQWLDPSMLYSSAIFNLMTPTLEAAQQRKLERIAEKLQLTGNKDVLEIGCGWGALAIHLATQHNANVTGITLSPSQLRWAENAAEKTDKADRIKLKLQDYRDVKGQFDNIVSVEMFEAVGEAYWPSYFGTLKRCLKPGGRAVLQIISIEENRFDTYRRKADFIQKYVFPGGFLPSDSALEKAVGQAGLKLTEKELFGQSYALTLAEWRQRFHARWQTISLLGFDERFRRMWDYYLCYCEAGFAEGTINVGLYTIEHG
ncbi:MULTISPECIES: SAM-dependent methyltransferase [Agrobacterium]|jgi:cyclopropane-fatty-acyl-phospholipid synthase|uniref:Class I SAM-dependent methyltransferase n=1 Tax=Agrobacterium pusense TaxID=648995 RepID=A0A6H0ZVH3_9HYPH|nr:MULTISPECIES: cyclopropane-fatty-acyl-phospholipid synthase family protein [Agrobacterium]ANV26732.1 SAM-dependent methyltransferase [Rhizobium sp. S41]KGE81873.1 SAM-dependent methyltransferase [Rhizobium sp. H41]MDH2090341.1 cyclopropane-fatty-acyl-phospholipid synthase family protein [Agrobacterium pusense]QIX23841.1 class I SAM-dependent methyltransferase [Agrobacterium pusense]QWW75750.1 cyclopropane-fatty-acyl-phospholipid synthase family protein [Agrobacterium pusense]